MKLTFRDLKQQKFTIDAEPSETILQVKEKIEQEKGWEAGTQKLIYSGKILDNAKTVAESNIEEKGFIVCMVSKTKPQAAKPSAGPAGTPATPSTPSTGQTATPAPPPAPQAAPSSTANPPATPSPAPPASATTSTAAAAAAATQPQSNFNDPSALLVGNAGSAVVEQMEAMGFQRAEIDRAMRAAFYNPDRAVDYLLNGIPESVLAEQRQGAGQQQQQQQQRATPGAGATATSPPPAHSQGQTGSHPDEPVNLFEAAAQQSGGAATSGGRPGGARSPAAAGLAGATAAAGATAGAGTGAGSQVNMDFLRNNPHFQQLRQLVQQSPAMLEPILQQVAEGNPQLAQLIGQNQDQFLQLLSEDLEGDDNQLPQTTIQVTEEERDAIERLCQLGFPRDAVVQAYFACDKNEELAASFLFDQHDDDQQQQ